VKGCGFRRLAGGQRKPCAFFGRIRSSKSVILVANHPKPQKNGRNTWAFRSYVAGVSSFRGDLFSQDRFFAGGGALEMEIAPYAVENLLFSLNNTPAPETPRNQLFTRVIRASLLARIAFFKSHLAFANVSSRLCRMSSNTTMGSVILG
jgi:hypothetical protein